MTHDSSNIANRAARLLSLTGKVAMVTGAGSGIGRGIALLLAQMGASIAVLEIDEAKGSNTVAEIQDQNGHALSLHCDVRSASDCRRAVGATIQKEEWDLALDVTLKGIYLLSREVVPQMARNGGGSIINIGSGWSLKGGPKAVSYCAAKGGAVNLTRAMAIDHGPHNIRVNCICPGDIDTPMLRSECAQLGEDVQSFMKDAANRPLARVGVPQDVANAVLFLASPMSTWITGTALVVDGGGLA